MARLTVEATAVVMLAVLVSTAVGEHALLKSLHRRIPVPGNSVSIPQMRTSVFPRPSANLPRTSNSDLCPGIATVEAVPAGAGGGATGGTETVANEFIEIQTPEEGGDVAAGASGGASGGPSDAQGILKHVGHYTGLDTIQTVGGGAKAFLRKPENLPFRHAPQHFFSCVDPRAKYAVLGTPGGDIGEFITALAAVEKLQQKNMEVYDVNKAFQDFIKAMLTRGKKYFFMHTDQPSFDKLAKAVGVADPLSPPNASIRNKVLQLMVNPEYVGCQHLKGMLSSPNDYGVRKEIVMWSIQTFLNVYFDSANPFRESLLLVVTQGPPIKSKGYARIWSPDECVGAAPALVPNINNQGLTIHHEAHAKYLRQDFARFFAFQNAMLDSAALFREIEAIATKQAAKITVYSEQAQPTDVIFKSKFDRWPF